MDESIKEGGAVIIDRYIFYYYSIARTKFITFETSHAIKSLNYLVLVRFYFTLDYDGG